MQASISFKRTCPLCLLVGSDRLRARQDCQLSRRTQRLRHAESDVPEERYAQSPEVERAVIKQ